MEALQSHRQRPTSHTPSSRRLAAAVLLLALLSSAAHAADGTLNAGFGQASFRGLAGGSVRATMFGNSPDGLCTGWIGNAPNHTLSLGSAFSQLKFEIDAPSDTTLIVKGPSGVRCIDDANGFNPRLSGNFAPGSYEVYVGSYDESVTVQYTLTVSE